jgi:hypothetical protein
MRITKHHDQSDSDRWLLFIFQLPAGKASQRVSVWRRLQKYGALAWKNAAYILPFDAANLEKFQWLAAEIRKHGGDASTVRVSRIEGAPDEGITVLFNKARARDYEALVRDLRRSLRRATAGKRPAAIRSLGQFNRRMTEIAAVDFFGCSARKEAERLLKELEARCRPTGARSEARRGKPSEYHKRLWMTRPRPGIDRVGSAWLIRNFIDAKSRFAFSSDPHAHPEAVRFDMFEGEFTHVGDDCTFETLMKRFALRDKRLRVIAQIIHDADLEDNKFGRPEGVALDLIFKGWARMDWADEEILKRGFDLYDALYYSLAP